MPNKLVELFQGWMLTRGMSLAEFERKNLSKMGVYVISQGFEEFYGKGKSPFTPIQIIKIGSAGGNILLEGRKYEDKKWVDRLKLQLGVDRIIFYNIKNQGEVEKYEELSRRITQSIGDTLPPVPKITK